MADGVVVSLCHQVIDAFIMSDVFNFMSGRDMVANLGIGGE